MGRSKVNTIGEVNIGFSYANKRLLARVTLPRELAQALQDAGFDRADLRITDDGILLVPFKSNGKPRVPHRVTLPESWGENNA